MIYCVWSACKSKYSNCELHNHCYFQFVSVKYGLISDSFHKQILIPYKKISIGLSALEKKILEILDILFVGFQG